MRHLASLGLMLVLAACQPAVQEELPAELDGRWNVQEIAGASLGRGVDVWIWIDAKTGAVHGFTGCNTFSTSMTSFGELLGVGAIGEGGGVCPGEAASTDEQRFLGVLPSVQRFVRRGRSLQLLPGQRGGETLMTLRLQDEADPA